MKIQEHNVKSGEVIEREMTSKEITTLELTRVAAQAEVEAQAQKTADKAALLEKLGITEDEAKLLLS